MAPRRARLGVAAVAVAVSVGASGAFGAYPGANGKLLFLRTNPATQNDWAGSNWDEIWVSDASGRRQQRVTIANPERDGVGVRSARWSPDGSLIAYATDCGDK